MRSQISVGVNLIVSMATMFCVGFYAGGTEADPRGARVARAPLTGAYHPLGLPVGSGVHVLHLFNRHDEVVCKLADDIELPFVPHSIKERKEFH